MPFKLNDDGKLAQDDKGLPIYIGPDGAEKPYDVDAKARQIAELTEKASKRGSEIEELKKQIAVWDDIEDVGAFIEQSRKDAATVASLADKDRKNEENMQRRITEAIKHAVDPLQAERDKLKQDLAATVDSLNRAIIGNAFSHSKYVAEKLVNPLLAQQLFEGSFYVKDGNPVGRDAAGKDIYGPEGIASFDEALCKMVEGSPFKENIIKPTPGGSGASNAETHRPAGALTPEQAGKLSPAAYVKARKEGKI